MTKKQTAATKALIAKGRKYYTLAYKPREMIVAKGKGASVWDLDGNHYIDFGAGISVTSLGHHNAALKKVLMKQAEKIWHTSNIFFTEPPILLAEALGKVNKIGTAGDKAAQHLTSEGIDDLLDADLKAWPEFDNQLPGDVSMFKRRPRSCLDLG